MKRLKFLIALLFYTYYILYIVTILCSMKIFTYIELEKH